MTEDELSRVQKMRVASFLFALEHMGGFGGVADRLNAYNVFRGDPALITTDVGRFQAVTPATIREVAARYLDRQAAGRLSVSAARKPTRHAPLDRRAGLAAPEPSRFASRAGSQRAPCGIPLWVFPRHDLPTVAGSIVITGGGGLQQPDHGRARPVDDRHARRGEHVSHGGGDRAGRRVDGGHNLDASCGWDGTYVSFRCLRSDLLAILDLTVDILLNPTFPETEWARVRARRWRRSRPSATARSRARIEPCCRHSIGQTTRTDFRWPEPRRASASSRARSEAFHARYLVPGQATIVVAGDVDPRTLADELDRRLCRRRGPEIASPSLPAPELAPQPRLLVLDRPGAPQAVVRAGHLGVARSTRLRAHPDLEPDPGRSVHVAAQAKLREERGFTYGVRSHFDCRRAAGPILDHHVCPGRRLAQALDDIHDELGAPHDRPPTQAELDDARRSLVEGHARHFETPSALVNRVASLVIHGLPADHEAGFADRLAAVDLESLIAQARPEIHPDSLVAIVVADAALVIDDLKRLEWAGIELIGRTDHRSRRLRRRRRDGPIAKAKSGLDPASVLALWFTTPIMKWHVRSRDRALFDPCFERGFSHGEELAVVILWVRDSASAGPDSGAASTTGRPFGRSRHGE